MREIDNNRNSVNINGIQKPQQDELIVNDVQAPQPQPETKEIKDLDGPEASIGKSQISTDSLENDMKFFAKHPEEIRKLNAVFEGKLLKDYSYEEAVQLMDMYKKEFISK